MIVFYETVVLGQQDVPARFEAIEGVEAAVCLDGDLNKALDYKERAQGNIMMLVSLRTRSILASMGIVPTVMMNDNPSHFRAQTLLASVPSSLYLNAGGFLLPFKAIHNHPAVPDRFFLKTDSGNKGIPGQVVSKSDLGMVNKLYRFDCHTLCLIAPVTQVRQEMRLWVGMDDFSGISILASAPYTHDDAPVNEAECQSIMQQAPEILKDIAARIQPCAIMVVDLGLREDGTAALIEINSANTSGTYGVADVYIKAAIPFLNAHSMTYDKAS